MEKSNFNKAYIYIVGIFAMGIAISNIISFFNGMGFALIGASVLLILAVSNVLKDEERKKRFGDIFALITIEILMLIVLFFAYDFNINGITNDFPLVMRNICAIYSIIAEAYTIFRYVSEVKGKKYIFVEYMLGNYVPEPKAPKEKKQKLTKEEIKKNKELENGTLAPKPSTVENFSVENTMSEDAQSQGSESVEDEVKDNDVIEKEDASTETSNSNHTGYWN